MNIRRRRKGEDEEKEEEEEDNFEAFGHQICFDVNLSSFMNY